jgi:integrase
MTESNGIRQLASGRYQARYRFAPGPRGTRTATFDNRRDAKTWLVSQEASLHAGVGIDPRLSRTLMADWWETWLVRRSWRSVGTREQYRRKWRTMLAPTFGPRRLRDVDAAMVERWRDAMLVRYAPRTVAHAQQLLSQLMSEAVRDRMIATNPVAVVEAPRVERVVVDAPERETVAALFEHAPEHMTVALHLALGAGLRSGEMRGLTVDRIDFDRGLLTIDRQLKTHPKDHVFVEGEWHHGREGFVAPKGQRKRLVPVESAVLDAIRDHLARRRFGAEGLVVTSRTGRPMGRGSWEWEWTRLCATVGISGFGVHQLRHAYASWLFELGANPADISRNLGHARTSFTIDMYVHASAPVVTHSVLGEIAGRSRVARLPKSDTA